MAAMRNFGVLFFLVVIVMFIGVGVEAARMIPRHKPHPTRCEFHQIYQLGDSISDTGNLIREPAGARTAFAHLPYGETFFGNATGRCSNGQLMIDFIASAVGLPFLNPYKNVEANFSNGGNFAVAGSTALPAETLAKKKILSPVTNSSLSIQLDWLSTHFNSTCDTTKQGCAGNLKNSLFMVGEIGGNDYNYALLQGKTTKQVKGIVPEVVSAVMRAVRTVIQLGGTRIVVPGNFPIGCLPIYLTAFQSNDSALYDENLCLSHLNSLARYHNHHLKQAIKNVKQEFPNVSIVYGDYYKAFQSLYKNAPQLGFDVTQRSCCGTGGKYNFNLINMCGGPNVPVCQDPSRHLSWDGIHLTEAAYKVMATWLMDNILPKLGCNA
ncbi:hypothetical protein RJ639_005669 [Escallonia herrerae]|uniref:Uncharacterized protein n=1 Tax=Escallonia herrerae TaxID=1293975 RepID=A0AA88VXN2_9ASTE|nr:hypothetical protein RJ639_005669 [Escallonia herrerae]